MFKGIDFYSDTLTRPTLAMRKAIAEAEVGDEQKGEDPTTRRLEEKIAGLLGFSSAMFFPSATMANEIAIRLHCEPGDELIAYEDCHLFIAESGGPAIHAQVMCRPIKSANGVFSGKDLRDTFRTAIGSHYPISKLVSVENTTNMGGGVPWTREQLDSVTSTAKALGLKSHMDGARFFNAVVATGVSPKDVASKFDTVTICLSKGLGCPMGALLTFDEKHWVKVRRLKQVMGGAMRQSGILSAAGLFALENNVSRLADDHKNATSLAKGLVGLSNIRVENEAPPTNMVYFRWTSPNVPLEKFLESCERHGIRFGAVGPDRIRAVTHLDVSASDIEKAVGVVRDIVNQ